FENFETEESFPEDWTLIDRDEDGTGFHREPEVGLYCWYGGLVSRSNNLSEQDNWAITPAITLPETASFLSFYALTGMDLGKICKEDHLMVFVGSEPTIDSMMPLSEDIGGCHGYEYYEYDLSEFAGETIYIAFRHYDSSDQWSVNIDDIAVYASLEVERDPVIMAYVKGALDGKLGIAFFVDLPDWITSDEGAYVTLTQCGETKVKALSEIVQNGVNEDGYYRIATYMPAAYYRDNVTMRFYDGNDMLVKIIGKSSQTDLTAIGVNYTLLKYVNSMKNNSDSKIKKLGQAMDDYCTAAQIYFERNTTGETLTLSDAVSGVTQSELEGFKAVRNGTLPSSITGVTLKASFEADNTLKLGLNFKNNKKPSGVKYYISEDGTFENAVATTVRGNATSGYYLAVRNIPAAYLGKSYTFFIVNEKDTSSNNTYSISCSLFTYARATAFNSTYSENLRNLTKAMYLYGKAAANYFGVTQ
ncbi:MAG: choice-of-anchor J domain-containing protein, partial [Lachnospiraceae bacterium]|nr:choice-of-anchor J domain-containing protein [Lachnospiraceae bacterium]